VAADGQFPVLPPIKETFEGNLAVTKDDVGSPKAGPNVAAILSIVESCRRTQIPLRDYLGAVLPGLAEVSIQRLAELTPAAWAARKQQPKLPPASRVVLV
jgi:hypothetical protein